GQTLYADHVGIIRIRMSKPVAAVEVPHVPELRAYILRHPNSITRIVLTTTRINRHPFPELFPILAVAFEPAGAQANAVSSLHAFDRFVLGSDRDTNDLLSIARLARNETQCFCFEHHVDGALL